MARTMPDTRPMADRIVLVTGGIGGIGRATAIGLPDGGLCTVDSVVARSADRSLLRIP